MHPDDPRHVEIACFQLAKDGQQVSGDTFASHRIKQDDRLISVLADGLGSGIKASVSSTLTATMALRCATCDMSPRRVAESVAEILPVCRERKMGYSTFSLVDIDERRQVRVVEYENPAFLLFRNGAVEPVEKETIPVSPKRPDIASATGHLLACQFEARAGDRLLVFSDGVTQSGLDMPGGEGAWETAKVAAFVCGLVRKHPDMSARTLARLIVNRARYNDGGQAKDDITCAVFNFRRPRRLLIATGPPMRPENDAELAETVVAFNGKKVVSGGTTAEILSRQLKRPLQLRLDSFAEDVPPASTMTGVDLVTEGMITLTTVATILESGGEIADLPRTPATELATLLLDSDVVQFVVGTRINDTLVCPDVPVYLDIRRNLVDRLRNILERKHLKDVHVRYV